MDNQNHNLNELHDIIINDFPYFIAINYQRLINETDWKEKTNQCIHVFDFTIRALSLIVIGQYLIIDRGKISDPLFNKLLKDKFPRASLGTWINLCFRGIQVYAENNYPFFIKELVNFYWDKKLSMPNKEVAKACNRLVEIRNEIAHGLPPQGNEEWKRLFEEAHTCLIEFLSRLRFLSNYNFILISEVSQSQCRYQVYRGTSIKEGDVLINNSNLKEGWFYLFPKDNVHGQEFLRLYPFFFGWTKETLASRILEAKDAALLDKFTSARIYYLATVAWQAFMVEDETLLADFFYNYEKALEVKKENVTSLDWDDLKQIVSEISKVNVSGARSKFNTDLYYQRNDVQDAFNDFLGSNKSAFILLGKSGVGKTNFFISQLENSSNPDCIYLFYEGAKIDTKISLPELIAREFQKNIILNENKRIVDLKGIFSLIARNFDLAGKRLVLIIDAINENESPKTLLEQINAFVEEFTYPWLRVAFSSRPEAWKAIKRGIRLSENQYYRQANQDELGIEVPPFVFSSELHQFSKVELPFVYQKYQNFYKLLTNYENIPYGIRQTLSDPLILKLVARIYAHKQISTELKAEDIFQKYIEHLVDDGVLRIGDLRFLENEIMPRMLSNSIYGKSIYASTIQNGITETGQSLFELIHNDDTLANNQRVNQSFVNLADAEILVLFGSSIDYELGFKYERFYDYFAGRRIQKLASTVEDREGYYLNFTEKTQSYPYLWGAVRYSLLQEFIRTPDKVIGLCFSESQRTKEMLVSVLTDFGQNNFVEVEAVIKKLVPHLQAGKRKSLRILSPSKQNYKTAWKISVEVASKVDISWVLLATMLSPDPSMRSVGVRYSYYLWQNSPDSALKILEGLIQETIKGIFPNLTAFESAAGLSLIIFFENSDDQKILLKLQSLWKRVINKIFGINENANRAQSAIRPWLLERFYSSMLSLVFRILRDFPNYNIVTSYKYAEKSVRMTTDEQELYFRLLNYTNGIEPTAYASLENDLTHLLNKKNLFLTAATIFSMSSNAARNPSEFLKVLKNFFEKALIYQMPNPYITDVPNVLGTVLDRHPENDEYFEFFVYTIQRCQQYYLDPQRRPALGTNEYPPVAYLGPYLVYQYLREGTVRTKWFEGIVNNALETNDTQFFDALMQTQMNFIGIERGYPNIALNALAIFFKQKNADTDMQIRSFLSRLRIYYPDLVDDFLEEQGATPDYILWIRTHEPEQRVGELIGIRVWFFLRDEVILQNENLRSILLQIFRNVPNSKNFRQWVDIFIREIVNLIYGSQILKQKDINNPFHG